MSAAEAETRWQRAMLAAAAFAVDPVHIGIRLRARFGPVRACWLEVARRLVATDSGWRRLPSGITDDRLLGGLDLAATLATGRPVVQHGLLAEADGGVLVLTMSERMPCAVAARIAAAVDNGGVDIERDGIHARQKTRFGMIGIDEGAEPDELPPPALTDRLAIWLDLSDIGLAETRAAAATDTALIAAARLRYPRIVADAKAVEAFCAACAELGIDSMRVPLHAANVARALAALRGAVGIEAADARLAAALVLAPRARRLPEPVEAGTGELDAGTAPAEPDAMAPDTAEPAHADVPAGDLLVEAARAALPPGLLDQLGRLAPVRLAAPRAGRSGAEVGGNARGRPAGAKAGAPRRGARLDVLATLRAAAPWQRLRRAEATGTAATGTAAADTGGAGGGGAGGDGRRVEVRSDDFRVTRRVQRTETTTIFVVDASGSAAMQRMGEAKGAVELLLADAYVRRDSVALIAFRDRGAELLLPPTRSLVRAKRCLAALPGGGGTPLASGLEAAGQTARAVALKGGDAVVVVLSDGRPNVALDGTTGRQQAFDDALAAARRLAADRFAAVWIDTGRRPEPRSREIASALGARWLALPSLDAESLSLAVRQAA